MLWGTSRQLKERDEKIATLSRIVEAQEHKFVAGEFQMADWNLNAAQKDGKQGQQQQQQQQQQSQSLKALEQRVTVLESSDKKRQELGGNKDLKGAPNQQSGNQWNQWQNRPRFSRWEHKPHHEKKDFNLLRRRTMIMKGLEKTEEKDVHKVLKDNNLCEIAEIEKIEPRNIGPKVWVFVMFKEASGRDNCLQRRFNLKGTRIYLSEDLSFQERMRRKQAGGSGGMVQPMMMAPQGFMGPNQQFMAPMAPWWNGRMENRFLGQGPTGWRGRR